MKKRIFPIAKGDTPQETKESFISALDRAYKALGSYKSDDETIDIILAHDDGSHSYVVLASLVSKRVGVGYDKEISIWENDKALAALGLQGVTIEKKMVIKQLLDKAFEEVGNLYNLVNLKCERTRIQSTYDWLMQMIDANFELKSDDHGRI